MAESAGAIAVARLWGREQNFTGEHLWARGYAVSTVGFELEQIRQYIRDRRKRMEQDVFRAIAPRRA